MRPGLDAAADRLVAQLQDELFVVGSALADPSPGGPFHHAITDEHVERLESTIDGLETELEPLVQFILPGGTPPAAQLHLARTVCRRAERLIVSLAASPAKTSPAPARLPESSERPACSCWRASSTVVPDVADILWKGM